MTRPPNLEMRVTARKTELIAEIIEHKMNSSRILATEEINRIKVRLGELAHIVNDGWSNMDPKAKLRVTEWLAR